MTVVEFARGLIHRYPFRMWLIVSAGIASNLLEGVGLALLAPMFSLAGMETTGTPGPPSKILGWFQQATQAVGFSPTLGGVLIVLLAIFFLQSLVVILNERLVNSTRFQYAGFLRSTLYEAILTARWEFIAKQKTGILTNALTLDPIRAAAAFLNLMALVRECVAVLIYVSLALIFSWQMAVVAVGIAGAGLYLFRARVAKGQEYGAETTLAYARVQEEAVEKLASAKLVKGFGGVSDAADRFAKAVQALANVQIRDSRNRTMVGALYQPLTATLLLAGLYAALTVFKMPMSDIMVLLIIVFRLTPRVSDLQMTMHEILSLLPSVAHVADLTSLAQEHRERNGGVPFHGIQQGFRVDDAWFAYENKAPVLRGVTLEVRKGETIAIVGPSGSGKTTMIDLLMGFIRPTQGDVLVDGVPLHQLNVNDWHRQCGYVPQEVSLFNETIRENLLWGKPTATAEEVEAAVRLSHADEFIQRLPQGYETVVGSRGVLLSGGQRQRLALARALIRKPALLILDEATSSLDTESEFMIQKTLETLARSMSVVIVAHRLATIQRADRIYVMEQGRIVESGSWTELTRAQGRFNELRQLQALT
ncbi:MAG: ABC transporter ATP-binding protein [Nitrospirae bacterium]|nr:ABC transporter ATP-binding protein [Nitrospirota bacterium]